MISTNIGAQEHRAWSYTDYNAYTFQSFNNHPAAAERIRPDSIDYKLLHAAVFYATNAQRHENHLPPFQHSPALEYAARAHSRDMVVLDFFSHTSLVTGKTNLADRLSQVGLKTGYRAENIAIAFALEYQSGRPVYTPAQNDGYFSYSYRGPALEYRTYLDLAETVVRQWMNSPGHRRNILNSNLKYLGIGAAFYRQHDFYKMGAFKLTQNFSSEDM